MIEGFQCTIKVKPLTEWVQKDKEGKKCPVCLMKPLVEFYMGSLENANARKQLSDLEKAWTGAEVLTIARTMDNIKGEVGDDLKKELVSYDCFAQSYEE